MRKKLWLALILSAILCTSIISGCASSLSTPPSAEPQSSKDSASSASTAPLSKYPERSIDLYVANAAGGGSDIFARTLEKIIRENKFCSQTINVVNRPGGSGAVNFGALSTQTGNDYAVSVGSTAFWTTPLSGNVDFTYDIFTPLANMCSDVTILVLNTNTGLSSFQEVADKLRAEPGSLTCAGTSVTSDDGLLAFALRNEGVDYKFVPFDSGGEANTALMGGHVDMTWLSPSEIETVLAAGNTLPIAVATEKRLETYPEIPTLLENGIDITINQQRCVVGAPGMSQEAIDWWSDTLEKVFNTPEFQDYVSQNMMVNNFHDAADFATYMIEIGDDYAPLVKAALGG